MEEIHLAEDGEARFETARVLGYCLPGFEIQGALTFCAAGDPEAAWLLWCGRCFLPDLLPTLLDARNLARGGKLRELLELDRQLTDRLRTRAAAQRAVGRRLVLSYAVPRIERVMERYQGAVAGEEALGNLPVIFGVRAAIFHVPPRAMLAGYLHAEAFLGSDLCHARKLPAMERHAFELAETHLRSVSALRAA